LTGVFANISKWYRVFPGGLTPLRRSYNDRIDVNDHFYTTDIQEQQAKIKDGYLLQCK
jgi:hypothetical protein